MHGLRSARHFARLVLAWFALALLVAIEAPMAQAESVELVCSSAGGMKLLVHEDGGSHHAGHGQDCQLCASLAAPPPVLQLATQAPCCLAHALQPVAAAHLSWLAAAPLPARGPPSFS